ncbi:hypothetical protein QP500_00560 [Pauljensenia sp. UMB0018B]|uniref:Uncharacterized protein n=1 Tax=Schaalia odontolytica TaxID=1660 RepID=A0A2I1I1R8_9ACTO|nr:hypothetical protein [Pauljensenia sp. UMB0018B]PKY65049.1 hypothetical protein CYJ22_02765 [Schaalia odontolytica]
MEIGGLVIVAVFVALFATVPSLVARRRAIVQSREIDRFSPKLRIIHTNKTELDTCDHASGTILARGALTSGGSMYQGTTGRSRPVIDRRNNKAVRDIAKLRARRAARLAAESAAGRRRMVVTGICALATVALGIVITATSIAWAWIAIPAAALVASLAASRVAAVRSQQASERELELLTKLRGDVRGAGRATAAAPAEPQASSSSSSEEVTEVAEATEPQTGSVPSLVFNVDVPEVVEVADTPARAWTVVPVPAPTYASRERVRGRIVHADTDLRGIPRIAAAVPARPIAQTAQVGARSTAEVVADQAVALDLDAVLDARRAQ